MSLEGGKILCYGDDGAIEKILEPSEKIFTIGYYVSCDVIHEHPEVKGIHCEISCDSFGRITVKNYCEARPIIVNGEAVVGTRPLLPGSTIEVVGKQFRWEYEPSAKKEDIAQTTPKANKVQPAPNSEPAAPVCRAVQKRLTVHSLNSDREADIENPYKCTVIQELQMNTDREFEKNQSSANSIDIASNTGNCTPKRRLSTCNHSDLVFTSYSPRTGINTPKGFACVTPVKKTPTSLYGTPRSALSDYNASTNSRNFTTPKGYASKISTSMHLIDLVTPLKSSRTPLKQTPLLKSALKNSAKSVAKNKGKKPLLSDVSTNNIQGRKMASETPVKKKIVVAAPEKIDQEQVAEVEINDFLLDSSTEQSTINTDSVLCNNSSVIEISSDGNLEEKKTLRTPQLVSRKLISISAKNEKSTEKDFAKKIKNNIETISDNLPTISKIKNRRSSLPATSSLVGKQSSLSQSTTGNLVKSNTTTPRRIITTSTPFRSQKSIQKMAQSTPLKISNLTERVKRHCCISSNQTTPKIAIKTPQKSIVKKETKTPKKDNKSVLFTDYSDESVNRIKENEEDTLNATFTIDEEEKKINEKKNESKNNQLEILELQPLEKIGDFIISDCLKEGNEHIQPIVDEDIQGINIPGQTNIVETSEACDNKNSLDKVSPKKVEIPSIITRVFRKYSTEHTSVDTDVKHSKETLETPRILNRTPVKEDVKTPKVEKYGSKDECVIKRLMRTPVKTPKPAKLLCIIPEVPRERNADLNEILEVPSIIEDSQDNFVDTEKIKPLGDILTPQRNEFVPNLEISEGKTPTDAQTLEVLKDSKSFTKLCRDKYSDYLSTSVTEPKSAEPKCNIQTPKKKEVGIGDSTELQKLEKSDTSNTSVAAIQRPSISEILNPEKLEAFELSVNTEIESTLTSMGNDSLQRKLRKSAAYKITTPTHLQTQKTKISLKNVVEVMTSEITEIKNVVLSTLASAHEPIESEILETESSKMNTSINLHTPQKTISSKNADEVLRIDESINIPSTPESGIESGQRKLRRYLHTKNTAKNMRPPDILIPLIDESPKNADTPSKELEIKESSSKSDFSNTPVTRHGPVESKLQRSNTSDVVEVPKKMQIQGIGTALENSTDVQRCSNPKKSEIPSISAPECKPTQKRLLRSSIEKIKILRHSLDLTTPERGETEENVDNNAEKFILEAPTSTNQEMETPIVLENNTETKTDTVTEHSGTKGPLVAFKPVLGIIRKITPSKIGATTSLPTSETPLVLEDVAELEKSTISENGDISAPSGEVQRNFQTSKISEAGTPVHLQKSSILGCDAEAEKVNHPENTNIPSTPIQDYNELQLSSIDKAEPQIKLQTSKISFALKCDPETQDDETSERAEITKTRVSPMPKINTPKRHSFMVIGQKMSAVKRLDTKRHTIGASKKPNLPGPTNDDNLLKTDLVPFSKNLDIVGKSIFTLKKIPSNQNLKLEHNEGEVKDKSFSHLNEDIETSDLPINEKVPEAEPRKLLKSATFIIDSLKRPNISDKSSQKELTDSGFDYALSEDLKHSEKLLKGPEEVNQTPHLEESPKSPKTLQTPRQLEVKECFSIPERPIRDSLTPIVASNESCDILDNETLLIEDDSYVPSSTSSQEEDESVLEGKYRSSPTTSVVVLKNSSAELRKSMNLFMEGGQTVSVESVNTTTTEFGEDEMENFELRNTVLYSCPTTPEDRIKNKLSLKSAVFSIEPEEDVCSLESFKTPIGECSQDSFKEYDSSDNTTDVTSNEYLPTTPNYINKSSKSQKGGKMLDVKETLVESTDSEKTSVSIGVKEFPNISKDWSTESIRELGLKSLMKTPIKTPKPVRLKELFYTPKPDKQENLEGLKELLQEPKNLDQTVVMLGVKELLNTPKDGSSESIRDLGLKRMMKTPISTPKPVKIKELFYTPKPEKEEILIGLKELLQEPKNLNQSLVMLGVKELLNTPESGISSEIREIGLKRLMKTPVETPKPIQIKELFYSPKPENEEDLVGVKELMSTPKTFDQSAMLVRIKDLIKTPKEVTSTIPSGIKEMFNSSNTEKEASLGKQEIIKTPESLKNADTNLSSVNQLLETPKSDANTEDVLGVPDMFSTPYHRLINEKNENLIKTPTVEFPDEEINEISLSPKNLSPEKQMSDDLEENKEDVDEEVFPTAIIDKENDTLSAEASFDKLAGKSFVRKSYGRSSSSQTNSSFAAELNKQENASLVPSSEEIDKNPQNVSDNAIAFSISGNKSLEKDDSEIQEIQIPHNSQDESLRSKDNIATDLMTSKSSSSETSTLKKSGKVMEYKKDDPTEDKEDNSQTDSDAVRNDSVEYINNNVVIEEKAVETRITSNNILEDNIAATTSTRSLRTRYNKNVELVEKQKLATVPKQTKSKRGLKKDDIEEKLAITAFSKELIQAPDSPNPEFEKNVEDQVDTNNSEKNKLNSSKESQNISEVKLTLRRTRKRKEFHNDTDKDEAIQRNSDSPAQPKRAARNKRNLKTQIPDDENQFQVIEETGRRGRRVKLVENSSDGIGEIQRTNTEELFKEKDIKIPKFAKESTTSHTTDQNEDLEEDSDKKANISNSLSSSDETQKSFSLPIVAKGHGRRKVVVVSPKTKSVTVHKRKSDFESEEEIVPLKRLVRKRGVHIKEDKSQQPNLETKPVTRRKADNVLNFAEPNLSRKEFDVEVTSSSEQATVKKKQESPTYKTGKVKSPQKKMENVSDQTGNSKVETTLPRRGRSKRAAGNNLTEVHQSSSSTESNAPPVRRGPPRRKADLAESENPVSENKIENASSKQERRRKVEDVIDTQQDLAGLTPPQRGRGRRKVEEPKAEVAKTNNLLNMSVDEITPVKSVILKKISKEKDNVSTPKTQSNDSLEFKTPLSAVPRARRVLRSNSISAQVLTPILQEAGQREMNVTNNSVEKTEGELPAATSTRTRGRRRLNTTKTEVEVCLEKLETSPSGDSVAKSGKTTGRSRTNSTKEEEKISKVDEKPEDAISGATSGRTRGRKRINSTKDEVKVAEVKLDQPETSRKTRGRKKVELTKDDTKSLDAEVGQPDVPEIISTAAIGTRTRGRKRINSIKEEVQIANTGKEHSELSDKISLNASTSGKTRARRNVKPSKT